MIKKIVITSFFINNFVCIAGIGNSKQKPELPVQQEIPKIENKPCVTLFYHNNVHTTQGLQLDKDLASNVVNFYLHDTRNTELNSQNFKHMKGLKNGDFSTSNVSLENKNEITEIIEKTSPEATLKWTEINSNEIKTSKIQMLQKIFTSAWFITLDLIKKIDKQ